MTESEERELDVLIVSPERFRLSPQIGTATRPTWHELALYLSRVTFGDAKDVAGAWSPARYRDNIRRKSALLSIGALVVDIDENGDVDRVAEVVGRYDVIVHETFSSTEGGPRCRVVLHLAEPVDASTYEALHRIVRARLAGAGIVADEGAKDASRLSFAPVRRLGAGYRFRQLDGELLDAARVLAAQPVPPPRPVPRPVAPDHRDAYVRGALRRAAEAVASASEGTRHYALCKEAFGLARLGLSEGEIAAALMPAFISVAGERRELEGRRTIRDAIAARARRGAA
jgi:hypothetical protein